MSHRFIRNLLNVPWVSGIVFPCTREVFSSSDMATNMNGKVEHLPEQTMHVAYKEEFVGGGSFFLL